MNFKGSLRNNYENVKLVTAEDVQQASNGEDKSFVEVNFNL